MIATALRGCFKEGYSFASLRADILAGLSVGVLAIPLAMALAIASGVPPQHGLYTSIVAGSLCALFGGSRLSVSGPTAAFVVLLAPVAHRFGLGGLALASLLAGVLLIAMGLARFGRFIQFIPYPVTTGFTAGIGVVIASLQLRDFFGLSLEKTPEHFFERIDALIGAATTVHPADAICGSFALILLIFCSKRIRAIPGPLIAIPLAAILGIALERYFGMSAATIGNRFHYTGSDGAEQAGIPALLPVFGLPWDLPGADGNAIGFSHEIVRGLLGPAFTIAMLGAIESLLCAVVADGMAGTDHDPDGELVGQGIGNIVAPFFGGFAATGAIARTATSVRSGARSPIAAFVHALMVLAALLSLGPLLAYLPMASLAALLLIAAWNMSDVPHVLRIVRIAPRSDKAVLLVCFALTVVFDMVVAVTAGVVLAAILFMRQMVDLTQSRSLEAGHPEVHHDLPHDVLLYQIQGPLFFGAAEKAVAALERVHGKYRAVIFDLKGVPRIDVTGVVALESAIAMLKRAGIAVAIAEAQSQPRAVIGAALSGHASCTMHDSLTAAIADVRNATSSGGAPKGAVGS